MNPWGGPEITVGDGIKPEEKLLFGCCESGIGRRDILCSGGSAIFSSLIAALLGDAKPARAQTISGNVPEVDRATVRVVTDNYHFALSPNGKIGDVEVGRVVFPLSDQPPGKVLLSEFGLSMHLETQRGNETRNVLIDFGYSSPTLRRISSSQQGQGSIAGRNVQYA